MNRPLILRRVAPVPLLGGAPIRPGATAVYCDQGGRVLSTGRPPGLRQRLQVAERTDVDTSEREARKQCSLPCRGEIFQFAATVELSWYVSDPALVVRRRLEDGEGLLFSRLQAPLRRTARTFDPADCADAEDSVNALYSEEFTLDGCLTVLRCRVGLDLDPRMRSYALAREDAVHEGDVQVIRIRAVEAAISGDVSVLLLHLAAHPDETEAVVRLIADHRRADIETRITLLQRLIDAGGLQDVDLDAVRDYLLAPPPEFVARANTPFWPPRANGSAANGHHADGADLPPFPAGGGR